MADPLMIAVRLAVLLALALLFGLPLFTLHACRGADRPSAPVFRGVIGGAALVGVVASALWLACLAAAMAGVPIADLDAATIDLILSGTAIGLAWKVRIAALLLVLLLALSARNAGRLVDAALTVAGAIALGSLAWTGHGAMDEGMAGWAHLLADIVHLLAAGAWIGALYAFLALAFRRHIDRMLLHHVLHGFAATGTAIVLLLVVTGTISLWMLVGPANLVLLPSDPYGRLLLLKLALFAAMLGLAAANRYRHTPALRAAPGGLRALRRSLLLETLAALAILALVAWLGLLAPPAAA